MRRALKACVFALCCVPAALLVQGLFDGSVGPNPVEALNRGLGDWALRFLIITLAIRPLADLTGRRQFMAYRRMVGLFAFAYAILHVANYAVIDLQLDLAAFVKDVLKRNYITVGMVNIMLLVALAATSTKGMIKRLGGLRWRRLHMMIYAIAPLAVLHYFMMVHADFREPLLYGVIVGALLAYRGAVAWRRRARQGAGAPA